MHLPATTYVWKFHPDSITRRNNGAYAYETVPEHIKAVTMAWEIVERWRPEQMEDRVVQFVHYNFFTLHRTDWQEQCRKELLNKAEDAFAQAMRPWMHCYFSTPISARLESYNREREKLFRNGMEKETLLAWLNRLLLAEKSKE